MEFKKAYKKFLDGTATQKEIDFVRSEMKKAEEVNETLNNIKEKGALKEADNETIKKAVKNYRKKDTLKIIMIVLVSIIAAVIIISLAIGIPILNNAKENTNITSSEAKDIATKYIIEKYPENASKVEVYKIEKELEIEGRVKNARYIYSMDVYNGKNTVIEIEVDSKTGNIIEID